MSPAVVDETVRTSLTRRRRSSGGRWHGVANGVPARQATPMSHESVADAFVAEAKEALIELFGNDPKSNSDYSRIINARTVDRLAGLIDPSKVIAGGKSNRDAHYLDPTLLYPITWDDKIMEDEIFGPILPILTYKSFDEAMMRVTKHRDVRSPASSSAATQKTIDRFIGQLSFGGGGVNLVNVRIYSSRQCRLAAPGPPASATTMGNTASTRLRTPSQC